MTNCFESKEGHGSNAPALHEVMCVSFSIAGLMPSEWSRNGRVLPGCSRSVRLGSHNVSTATASAGVRGCILRQHFETVLLDD